MKLWLAAVLLAAAPARAQTLPSALVWLPAEKFTDWSKVDDLLRRRADLKLTVALTPGLATPAAKDALKPWAAAGRVELAARIEGDPILPLVDADPAAPRPDDALERASESKREVERRLGAPTPGLVVGGGALDVSLVGPVANAGSVWTLVGPFSAEGSSLAAAGGTLFVPARAAPRGVLLSVDLTAPGAWVFDESADAGSAFLDALAALPSGARPDAGWTTVSAFAAALPGPRADAASVAAWPGWDGAPAAADPAAHPALRAYLGAAEAVIRYQNSGTANLKVLEDAAVLLRRAQDARFLRAPAPGAPAIAPELRARVLAVYRRLHRSAPDSLYATDASTSAIEGDQPTGVRAASGPDWLNFDNPAGSLALAPTAGASPEAWRLKSLRVEWDEQHVLFGLFVGQIDAVAPQPRPVFDVYIDLNHIVGAGSIRLLDGRGAFAAARDAWEYALTVVGTDARLWRASADGAPEELATLTATAVPATGEIRVSVPRDLLRGNPPRWGYLALSLAEDPRRPGLSPAAPLVGPDGSVLRGLLAPLEVQQTVFSRPGVPQRVPSARLDAAP
ncbi:MAG: hypothetical protein HKL90_04695 [Elusimicrobia bacterium]|nr:hypothetical protein [Elusimicrobiota bacterium]